MLIPLSTDAFPRLVVSFVSIGTVSVLAALLLLLLVLFPLLFTPLFSMSIGCGGSPISVSSSIGAGEGVA